MINLTTEQFKKKYGEAGIESFKPENVRDSLLTTIRKGIGEAQSKPTYLSRVATKIGDAANKRADEFSAIDQLGSTGVEKFVQKAGTSLALPFKDVIGAGLSELPGAKQVGESFAAEIKKASEGNLAQFIGNKIGENASVQEIVDLYDNDPNFRQTVNSTFNVVNAIVTAKGIGDTAVSVKGMLTPKKAPIKQAAVGSDEIGVKEYNVAKPKPIANPEIDTVVNNHVKSAKMILQDATENGDNIPLNTLIADTKKEILAGLQKTDNAAYKVAAKQITRLDPAQFSSVDDFSNAVKNVVNNPSPNSITFGDNVYTSPRTAGEKVPFAGRVMPADPNVVTKAKTAVQSAKDIQKTISDTIFPKPTAKQAVGQIVQGKTKDVIPAAKAISNIDTTGVKTFADLKKKFDVKTKDLMKVVDSELAKDPAVTPLKDLTMVKKSLSGKPVVVAPVKDGLKQLKELYTKTGDAVSLANIKELIAKARSSGLTKLEVNNIARNYGTEFGSKAFSKTGDPLTTVNAQLFENTRSDLKEIARAGITGEAAKIADAKMSTIIRTNDLIKKNVEAVNKLQQKINERGPIEKYAHLVTKYADIVTGGTIRGLIGGPLPRGAGYKVLNALDLEEVLQRNLEIIRDALKTGNGKKLEDIFSKTKSNKNIA